MSDRAFDKKLRGKTAGNEGALSAGESEQALSSFVLSNEQFILKQASKAAGRFITKSDDEWSAALMAFCEAVKSFDPAKGNFYPLAAVAIRRRVIDELRKSSRHSEETAVDFSAVSADEEEENLTAAARTARQADVKQATEATAAKETEADLRDEFEEAAEVLAAYGIDFYSLPASSPKTRGTRTKTGLIVKTLIADPELMRSMKKAKALPMTELSRRTGIPMKVFERHRNYLIAAALLSEGPFPHIRSFIHFD